MYLLEGKYLQAAYQWCFIQKVLLKFTQNSLEHNCVGVLSYRPGTCSFFKKVSASVFFFKLCETFYITFLQNIYGSCFWIILFTYPYDETQIKPRVLPFRKYNTGNLKVETYSCWMTTFDYFRLQMQWFF